MPLLSNKQYILNPIRKKDETVTYYIQLTNEICEDEHEKCRKEFLYEKKIWYCRISGQQGLNFHDAMKSEQNNLKNLKTAFKKCFEKPALKIVHLSKDSLDILINKVWRNIHELFHPNEPVTVKLYKPQLLEIPATIIKVDPYFNEDNNETEMVDANELTDAPEKKNKLPEKKKVKYIVKLSNMDKVVKQIPVENVIRTVRPPSKDHIRLFIRAHAFRHLGKQMNPWVVDEDFLKKYNFPSLEPEYSVTKDQLKTISKQTEIQYYKKLINGELLDGVPDDNSAVEISDRKSTDNNNKVAKKSKQLTLFDGASPISRNSSQYNQKGDGNNTIKSPYSSSLSHLPSTAQKLMKSIRSKESVNTIKQLIYQCAIKYDQSTIAKFPDLISRRVMQRRVEYEEKNKTDAKSIAEKNLLMRAKLIEKNRKYDDDEMQHDKELPEYSPVNKSDKISIDEWSRVVSVCEFIRCYIRLLNPTDRVIPSAQDAVKSENILPQLHVKELCNGLLGETDHDRYVYASTICMLLKPILQDKKIREIKEMGLNVSELPVTAFTASEILRLVLPTTVNEMLPQKNDQNGVKSEEDQHNNSKIDAIDDSIDSAEGIHKIIVLICDKLGFGHSELHELSLSDKIQIMELLKDRILELEVMSNFLEEHQREVVEVYKLLQIENNEATTRIQEIKESKLSIDKKIEEIKPKILKLEANNNTTDNSENHVKTDESEEFISTSTKRRMSLELAAKEKVEKERIIEFERERNKLTKEEESLLNSIKNNNAYYKQMCFEGQQLMRVKHKGYDRYNRRYWYFPTASDRGLFVEHYKSDKWGWYHTVEQLEELHKCLSDHGLRESVLKHEVRLFIETQRKQNNSDSNETIVNFFPKVDYSNDEDKALETDSFLVFGFKRELIETEINIRQGSLGGVKDFKEWQTNLRQATDMYQMRQALIDVFLGVNERFFGAPLKTANGRSEFISEVSSATSQTRLNLLQCFLDACVMWNKASSDSKCRICRKSNSEKIMLLCDNCNLAYHIFCLRPPLLRVPAGEWLCSRCSPDQSAQNEITNTNTNTASSATKNLGVTNNSKANANHNVEESVADSNSNEQDSEEEVDQENNLPPPCTVCGDSSGDLARCCQCDSHYHSSCHEPPMRSARRTNTWKCSNCRNNDNNVTNNHKTTGKRRERYTRSPSSNSESYMRESSCEDVAPKKMKRGTNISKRARIVEDSPSIESEPDQAPGITRGRSCKRPLNGVTSNGPSNKRAKTTEKISEQVNDEAIGQLIKKLYSHRFSGPFVEPVDAEAVPDYYDIIEEPMCLDIIKQNHINGIYNHKTNVNSVSTRTSTRNSSSSTTTNSSNNSGLALFGKHIGLIFTNAEIYNQPESDIVKRSIQLENYFVTLYNKYNFDVPYIRESCDQMM